MIYRYAFIIHTTYVYLSSYLVESDDNDDDNVDDSIENDDHLHIVQNLHI